MKKRLQQIVLAIIYAVFVNLDLYLLRLGTVWLIMMGIVGVIILIFVGYRYYRDPNARYYTAMSSVLLATTLSTLSRHDGFNWFNIVQIGIGTLILGFMVSYVVKGYPQARKPKDK